MLLCLITLSGCISPQDLVAEPGGSTSGTVTPTSTSSPREPAETGATDMVPVPVSGTSQFFVKTPYGYLLTSPTTGIRLSIVEIKDEVDATGQRFISGKIKNDENFRINHITVNFNLYNPNGNLIGNAHASVNSLGPGKVWKFSTNSFSYKDYNYYEMAGIFTA
ncbi:MAG: FxLYD domain-containing protein [Methanolinea sp.]|nr:FxLYD domain-containing protein [Methanolinea sp.]